VVELPCKPPVILTGLGADPAEKGEKEGMEDAPTQAKCEACDAPGGLSV
jgi:hypothetical protein